MSKILLLSLAILVGCSGEPLKTQADVHPKPIEVSLKADRSQLDDLRKEIPDEKKKENDELAAILDLFTSGGYDQEPNHIREKFDRIVRDKRLRMDREMRKARDEYNKEERKKRADFTHLQKQEHDDFEKKKPRPEDRKDFNSEQESKRQEFYSDERNNRAEFESNMNEKRHDIDDYLHSKSQQFSDELRNYSRDYYNRKTVKDSKAQKKTLHNEKPGVPEANDLDDFKKIPNSPGVHLAPEDQ